MDYNCDIEHVVNVLREVVKQNKFCLDDPAPLISFSGFQDSSLGFTVGAWCQKDNFLDCQKTLAHDIKRRFEEEGISFPSHRSLESRSPIKVENLRTSGEKSIKNLFLLSFCPVKFQSCLRKIRIYV